MIPLDQDELEGIVERLHDQPGSITVAVVPGSEGGDALVERLRKEIPDLPVEVADPHERPAALGARAAQLGRTAGAIFILPIDGRRLFRTEDEAVAMWSELNYQRESLAFGNVRTCLLVNEETERGLVLIADDLRDWAMTFRFPEALPPPEATDLSIPLDRALTRPSVGDIDFLRDQWQRARTVGIPERILIENYAAPLFLALADGGHFEEATRLWMRDLRSGETAEALPLGKKLRVLKATVRLAMSAQSSEHREEMIQRALAAYEATRREHPQSVVANTSRAEVLKALGRLPDALTAYEEACREHPEDIVAKNGRAEVLKALDRLPDALAAYEDTCREHPEDIVAKTGRAEVLKALGRLPEALAAYEEARREHPEDIVAKNGRAEVLKAMGRLQEALAAYEEVSATHPQDVVAKTGRAQVLKTMGR